ncbi:MAG: TonB-dependent receptor [Woeseiaceae bacterium]|nr:TonB-dependent receptor [Woeseiaceae bacterium]
MTEIRRAVRRAIGVAAGTAIFAANPVLAQDADDDSLSAPEVQLEEIIVTSSRIQKPDYAFSNPVVSVDAEQISFSGATSMTEFLKDLPALTGSLDANDAAGSNAFIGGTGLTLLDLRNLGIDRTLVLVDGRRHVASLPGSAAVDIDTIPIDLIERVEVQTGGASAIYGADGVSGVVNLIMKKDFEGLSVRARFGESSESDSENRRISVLGGMNFANGRGNITGSLEFNSDERLNASARTFAAGGQREIFVDNPAELGGDDPNVPDEIPLNDIRFFDSSLAGAVDTDFDFVNDFNGTDTPWNGGTVPFIPPFLQQGGDGTPLDLFIGDLLPEEERTTANLFARYEFSDRLTLFGEAKFSRTEAFSESQPTFDFFLWLEPDYAFLTPNIAAAAAGNAGGGAVLVSRDHFDLGVRAEDITRDQLRGVIGIEGDLPNNFRYEISYVYGETEVENNIVNNRLNDRWAAALDAVIDPATGQATCRSNLDPTAVPENLSWQGWEADFTPLPGTWAGSFTPGANSGCVPVDILGDGDVSPEAAAWINTNSLARSKLTQNVVQGYISGDSERWFELPAGPIGIAAGFEWREEESESNPPIEDQLGLTFGNVLSPERGEYDVTEFFGEVDVPLIADAPFAQLLSVDAAVRFSDYSTIGNATTWKVGGVWTPVEDLSFRATVAEATRAPNIGELFDPGGQTFQFITDPCDITETDQGTEFRAANCAALLNGLGVDPTTFIDPNSASIPGTLQGNTELTEEVADTTTIGVIYRPRFIENLTLAVDWYDIELDEAINTARPQVAADLCVDLPTLDNQFCGLIDRDGTTGGIVDFRQQPVNVANFRTEGFDFTVNYLWDPANWGIDRNLGTLNLRVIGNKLEDLTFINLPGADPDSDLGESDPSNGFQAPEYQVAFNALWARGPLAVNYSLNWFDETQRYTDEEIANNPDIAAPQYLSYDDHIVQDLQVRWDHGESWSFYGGVNNLTDEKPDIGETFFPVSAVGRYFYVGFDYRGGL